MREAAPVLTIPAGSADPGLPFGTAPEGGLLSRRSGSVREGIR